MQMSYITLYEDLITVSNNKKLAKGLPKRSNIPSRGIKQCHFRINCSENTKSLPSFK